MEFQRNFTLAKDIPMIVRCVLLTLYRQVTLGEYLENYLVQ